jgi:hypothetical protein
LQICFLIFFAAAMASNQGTSSPTTKANKRTDYYPLWSHVTKVSRIPGGGSWEWVYNLCHKPYKGSYPRVKAHFLHDSRKGVDCFSKTIDLEERRKYEMEQEEVDGIKKRHEQLASAIPRAPNIEPRIVHEAARKRRAAQQQQPASKSARSPSFPIQERRISKMVNVQGR